MSRISIFDYDNYRVFLRDFYEASRARDKKFSYRFFSRLAGFKSSGSILKVINGKTNLSLEGIKKIVTALKLNKEEAGFFMNLALLNQAKTSQERQIHAQTLLKSQTYRKLKPLNTASFEFYSKWYYSPIRELVNLPDFSEEPEWVASKLMGRITSAEAKSALLKLELLGLLARDSNGGLLVTDTHITSGDEVSFSGAAGCHRQFLELASQSIDQVPRELRDLSAMTIGVSVEMAKKIKELIQQFRNDVVDVVSRDSEAEVVYQLNMQLFPLTESAKVADSSKKED